MLIAARKIKELIPANVRPFLLRGLALVVGWNLLYHLLLAPLGVPDNQLTAAVQFGTAKLLTLLYSSIELKGPSVFINGIQSINIAPQCNGLELMVLYVGFIICIPSNAKKMLLYSVAGITVIYILNIIRCTLLGAMYYEQHALADFAHHYAFKMVVYAAVFYGWVLYARKPRIASEA